MSDNLNTLVNMVRAQHEMNTLAIGNDKWFVLNHPFYRKAWQEAAEIVDHLNDNWWKKTPFNHNQVKLEVVDIFHFLISEAIKVVANGDSEFYPEEVASFIEAILEPYVGVNLYVEPEHCIQNVSSDKSIGERFNYIYHVVEPFIVEVLNYSRSLVVITDKQLIATGIDHDNLESDFEDVFDAFFRLLYATDMTFDSLKFWYFAKMGLNIFRRENGYKSGTYTKIWNGLEDNQYLFDLEEDLASLEPDEIVEKTKDYLSQVYTSINIKG